MLVPKMRLLNCEHKNQENEQVQLNPESYWLR